MQPSNRHIILRFGHDLKSGHTTEKTVGPQREISIFFIEFERLLGHSFPVKHIMLVWNHPLENRQAINHGNNKKIPIAIAWGLNCCHKVLFIRYLLLI